MDGSVLCHARLDALVATALQSATDIKTWNGHGQLLSVDICEKTVILAIKHLVVNKKSVCRVLDRSCFGR